MKVWRYDRAEVPADDDDRLAWLYEKWAVMDDWIDERLRARSGEDVAVRHELPRRCSPPAPVPSPS